MRATLSDTDSFLVVLCNSGRAKVHCDRTGYGFPVFCAKVSAVLVLVGCFSLFALCGCGSKEKRTLFGRRTPQAGQISKEELRESLNNFEEFAVSNIKQVADRLDLLLPDIKTQKTNLLKRAHMQQAFHTMLEQEDPIIAFIEIWALCVRARNYLEEGEGSNLYGDYQEIAITVTKRIETGIEQIGRRFLKEDVFEETRRQIHNFAGQNPIKGVYSNVIVYATQAEPGKPSTFDSVIALPMSPFTALQGVDRTATAIHGVRGSMDHISDVVKGLPESARWQMLLLLLDMEETELAKTVLASMSKLSDSSVRLADSAEKLPEQLRQQLSLLIKEIDEEQENLQTTLDKAEKVAASVESASAGLSNTAEAFGRTVQDINQTAQQWDAAAKSTALVLQEFTKLKSPKKETAEPAKPFNILEYRDTAAAVGEAVNEMRNLTAELNKLLESRQFAEYALIPEKITTLLTWRLGQLIVLFFASVLVYRIVVIRFVKKPK
jgi:hypothetical protein